MNSKNGPGAITSLADLGLALGRHPAELYSAASRGELALVRLGKGWGCSPAAAAKWSETHPRATGRVEVIAVEREESPIEGRIAELEERVEFMEQMLSDRTAA